MRTEGISRISKGVLLAGLFLRLVTEPCIATETRLCQFETGFEGFAGSVQREAGKGCNESTGLFLTDEKGSGAIAIYRLNEPLHDLSGISIWIQSTKLKQLAVRFVDASGQCFQQSYDLTSNTWHCLAITNLTAGQSWGGANDQKWHGPCDRFELRAEEAGATCIIDNIKLTFRDEPHSLALLRQDRIRQAKKITVATFDTGLDEFYGTSVEQRKDTPAEGTGYARIQNQNQDFVEIGRKLALQNDLVKFTFSARNHGADHIAVRFSDATGQEFLHRIPLPRDNTWQNVSIFRFDHGDQSWGGANDQKWHPPARAVSFVLENKNAAIDIDTIQACVSKENIIPEFVWRPTRPSNVFLSDEETVLPFETRADQVEFHITDFWGKEISIQNICPEKGCGTLKLPSCIGYFLVKAHASKDKLSFVERYTSYAVIPPLRYPDPATSRWGVATHFAQGLITSMLPTLKKAGLGLIRDEMYWDTVETQKGQYHFSERFQDYMKATSESGLLPLIILNFANPLYDQGLTPHTDAGCDAFGEYGSAVMRQFGSQIQWLEIWNEYNGTWCEGPATKDRPLSHVKLLKHAYTRIKAQDPNTMVIGGAAVLLPRPYMEGIFSNGGLAYMDGLVIHPYRDQPEGVDDEIDELRNMMRQYNHGKEKEIWVTETGLDTKLEFEWEKGRHMYERGRTEAARYLVRQYALLLKSGCKRIFWYTCADSEIFPAMGLLRREDDVSQMGPLTVTPNYVAMAIFIRQLDCQTFQAREGHAPYSRAYCLRFGSKPDNRTSTVRICWAVEPSAFDLYTLTPVTVTDIMGGTKTLSPAKGKVRLPVDLEAVYVHGNIEKVEEVDAGNVVLAATYEDYSHKQGTNNWHYGYRESLTGKFKEMTWQKTEWEYRWVADGFDFLHQSRNGGEPGGNHLKPVYMDRRWISPTTGLLELCGEISSDNKQSDGLDVHVTINNQKLFNKILGGGETWKGSIPLNVKSGDTVDILIGPHKETSYDSCRFNLRVMQAHTTVNSTYK